jgi:hypothetical protein
MGWTRKRVDAESVYYSAHYVGSDGKIRTESGFTYRADARDAVEDAEETLEQAALDQAPSTGHDPASRQD